MFLLFSSENYRVWTSFGGKYHRQGRWTIIITWVFSTQVNLFFYQCYLHKSVFLKNNQKQTKKSVGKFLFLTPNTSVGVRWLTTDLTLSNIDSSKISVMLETYPWEHRATETKTCANVGVVFHWWIKYILYLGMLRWDNSAFLRAFPFSQGYSER